MWKIPPEIASRAVTLWPQNVSKLKRAALRTGPCPNARKISSDSVRSVRPQMILRNVVIPIPSNLRFLMYSCPDHKSPMCLGEHRRLQTVSKLRSLNRIVDCVTESTSVHGSLRMSPGQPHKGSDYRVVPIVSPCIKIVATSVGTGRSASEPSMSNVNNWAVEFELRDTAPFRVGSHATQQVRDEMGCHVRRGTSAFDPWKNVRIQGDPWVAMGREILPEPRTSNRCLRCGPEHLTVGPPPRSRPIPRTSNIASL